MIVLICTLVVRRLYRAKVAWYVLVGSTVKLGGSADCGRVPAIIICGKSTAFLISKVPAQYGIRTLISISWLGADELPH